MRVLAAMAAVAAVSLGGCAEPPPPTATTPSPDGACEMAFDVASGSRDAVAVQAALEGAISACQTADEWARASQKHAGALQGVDAQQFLVDRCLNGPPDIADSTLCQTLRVDR